MSKPKKKWKAPVAYLPKSRKLGRALSQKEQKRVDALLGGRGLYQAAFDRFGHVDGAAIMARAARKVIEREEAYKKRRATKQESMLQRMRAAGYSESDIKRYRERAYKFKPHVDRGVKHEWVGPNKGKYILFYGDSRPDKIISRKTFLRLRAQNQAEKRIRMIANNLEISKREARGLMRAVKRAAVKQVEIFKKSAKYKGLTKREKQRYSRKRIERSAASALSLLVGWES